jgi:hypothetical protein
MNNPIVVNMYAGPGASKSTIAAGVFSLLKLHNVNVELVTEVAKDFTWEERHKTLENQYYVWAKQQHRIWRLRNQVNAIITDSPLLLSLIYGENNTRSFYKLVIEEYNEYNNVNYYIERDKAYQQIGRFHTENEAINLDNVIKRKLQEYNIHYKTIKGNIEGLNIVACDVLEKLGKERLFFIGRRTILK